MILDYGGPNETRVDEFAFHYRAAPGEIILARKGGGGGWGCPLDRSPENVLADVIDEYVTVESARRDYGVVIDPAPLTVDMNATQELRASIRSGEKD